MTSLKIHFYLAYHKSTKIMCGLLIAQILLPFIGKHSICFVHIKMSTVIFMPHDEITVLYMIPVLNHY